MAELFLNPKQAVFRTFEESLEPFDEDWLKEVSQWEGYIKAFFRSNGLHYEKSYNNIENSIRSQDRAPFAYMIGDILEKLPRNINTDNVKLILFSHWTPDLHMGTSVINYAIQQLQLEECFALAISDRGPSAPLFALDCANNYMKSRSGEALLIIADQKNLIYRSHLIETLQPKNNAMLLLLNKKSDGLCYRGYKKFPCVTESMLDSTCKAAIEIFGLRVNRTYIVASSTLLDQLISSANHIAVDDRLVCAAPFAVMVSNKSENHDYLLAVHYQNTLYAVGFKVGNVD